MKIDSNLFTAIYGLCLPVLAAGRLRGFNTPSLQTQEHSNDSTPSPQVIQNVTNEELETVMEFSHIQNQNRKLSIADAATGSKHALIVLVGPWSNPHSFQDAVFGTHGDAVNPRSQLKACSYGKFTLDPYIGTPTFPTENPNEAEVGEEITNGMVTVHLDQNIDGQERGTVMGWVKDKLQAKGILDDNQKPLRGLDHILFVLPYGTVHNGNKNWNGEADIPGWLSVYNCRDSSCSDHYIMYPHFVNHLIGHNLGLHHASEGSEKSGDKSGVMGSFTMWDDHSTCFNGAHSWNLGWYSDKHSTYDPVPQRSANWKITSLVGVAEYDKATNSDRVIVKIPGKWDNYFVAFNSAKQSGINKDSGEGQNQVLITKQWRYGQDNTYLESKLSLGGTFTIPKSEINNEADFENVSVEVTKLDTGSVPARAEVYIRTNYPAVSEKFTYAGCFKDQQNRDLPHQVMPFTFSTIENCVVECEHAGYDFAGLQNGNECWCGNDVGSHGRSTECNKSCYDKHICGGAWANSVYVTSEYPNGENEGFPTSKFLIQTEYSDSKCLDSSNPSDVRFEDCDGSESQQWTYDKSTNEIKNVDGKCLDHDSGANMHMHPCHGGNNQQFEYQFDTYTLKTHKYQGAEVCVDYNYHNGDAYGNTNCHSQSNQQFKFTLPNDVVDSNSVLFCDAYHCDTNQWVKKIGLPNSKWWAQRILAEDNADNSLSYVTIPAGYFVQIAENSDFGGRKLWFGTPDADRIIKLGDYGFDNKASAVAVGRWSARPADYKETKILNSGKEQCGFDTYGKDFCNDWCNTPGIWGCGIASWGPYTCDCSGCNGC